MEHRNRSAAGPAGRPQHLLVTKADGTLAGRRALLSSRAIRAANTCSTAAGPKPTSAPAAAITPNCRSRCRLRRRPGRRLLVRPGPARRRGRASALAGGLVEICRPRRRLRRPRHLRDRAGIPSARRARLPAAHRPAVPLAECRLRQLRRLSRRALVAQAQDASAASGSEALANGISVHWLTGSDLTEEVWDAFFAFYMETGSRKWGRPYLTRDVLFAGRRENGDRILLVMAKRAGRWIAGAINFIGSHTLFGRHWGAIEHHPFLHFELCYYQAIDYAIAHKLPASRPAPRASTRSRAAICRRRPIRRITSPIRRCAGRSPTTWRASAPMWRPRRGACGDGALPQGFGRSSPE